MKLPMKSLPVLALLLGVLTGACDNKNNSGIKPSATAQRNRSQVAEAMFQERCKTAGEKIHRTVENVERIFLMKLRPQKLNFSDQFAMDDPYGRDLSGDGYIETFTKGSFDSMRSPNPQPGWPHRIGYRDVQAIDPNDGKRYLYTGRVEEPWQKDKSYLKGYTRFVLDRTPATGPMPRYGVTYDDISTRKEREYWIAGSSLKVVDLKTNEVIAERIGYMMDPQQGNISGGRSPWLLAANHACPDFHRFPDPVGVKPDSEPGYSAQAWQTEDFAEKVLKPTIYK